MHGAPLADIIISTQNSPRRFRAMHRTWGLRGQRKSFFFYLEMSGWRVGRAWWRLQTTLTKTGSLFGQAVGQVVCCVWGQTLVCVALLFLSQGGDRPRATNPSGKRWRSGGREVRGLVGSPKKRRFAPRRRRFRESLLQCVC